MDDPRPTTILVKDWLSQWLENKAGQGRKLNTQERYEGIIRLQIIPYLGDVELKAVTPGAIDAMHSDLLRSGLAASTVRNAHTILSSAYKEAQRWAISTRTRWRGSPRQSNANGA